MSQPGRNEPCPCGSGRKLKACCGRLELRTLVALLEARRYAEFEAVARQQLQQRPEDGLVWQLIAASLRLRGQDALEPLRRAAQLLPRNPSAHNNLGNGLAAAGQSGEAVASYRRALELNPDFPEAFYNLGNVELDSGQYEAASELYRRAVELKADYAQAWNHRGRAVRGIGRLEQAVTHHERALAIRPDLAEAHHDLGMVLRDLDRLEESVASHRRALALAPEVAEWHRDLAVALRLLGRSEEAEISGARALALNPASAAAWIVLAEIQADRGQFDAAREHFQRALALEPGAPDALAGIARLRRMTLSDAEWLAQAQRAAGAGLPARQEVPLRYAIGKYFDDVGNYEQAFAQFQRANELTRTYRTAHDRQQLAQAIDGCMAAFPDRAVVAARESAQAPVFIVGMLRSGTTLAEQILASHAHVFGAGELIYWSRAAPRWQAALRDGTAGPGLLDSLARDYRALLLTLAPLARRVIDKMPSNFQHLGLIHQALPEARILHMRRHPIDTCLSIYSQHLEATHSYANDLGDLAHAYEEYRRIMRHWRAVLPPHRLLEVSYEGLVDEPEVWSRRMVEFIGLDWDPACLAFERTPRTVVTASRWQVRQPINRDSIARWRHYEEFVPLLRPLLEPD